MTPKCCGLCGRWGTRGFREADSSDRPGYSPVRDGQWVCVNDRACKRRAAPPLHDPQGSTG